MSIPDEVGERVNGADADGSAGATALPEPLTPRRYRLEVSAISFRPSDELHTALRDAAKREGRSIQSLLDAAACDYLERPQRSIATTAHDARERHAPTFEALADL